MTKNKIAIIKLDEVKKNASNRYIKAVENKYPLLVLSVKEIELTDQLKDDCQFVNSDFNKGNGDLAFVFYKEELEFIDDEA